MGSVTQDSDVGLGCFTVCWCVCGSVTQDSDVGLGCFTVCWCVCGSVTQNSGVFRFKLHSILMCSGFSYTCKIQVYLVFSYTGFRCIQCSVTQYLGVLKCSVTLDSGVFSVQIHTKV